MTGRNFHLHNSKGGSAITVRVTPRSNRNQISDIQADGTIRIRLTAPPVDGRANDLLIEYLAEVLEVPKATIEIVAGESGRDKLISILDLDPETVQKRLIERME